MITTSDGGHEDTPKDDATQTEGTPYVANGGVRLYWADSDPAADPDYVEHRPRVGDLLIYAGAETSTADAAPSLHRYTGTAWQPSLRSPGGLRPSGTGTPWPIVSLSKVREAARADPDRPQGGTTPGAEASVKQVEEALWREGLLSRHWSQDGSFGAKTVQAYAAWQRYLGYTGSDADGIPGRTSLTILGRTWSFTVTD